ncbi:MAG: 4Fe-4S binding protein [Syntrophomonadaceae bacterium]|nr:4Fe-4S binding protein [Syntrophomonadaceae bacterium]
MPYRITDDCIACGACTVVCREDAILDGYSCHIVGELTPNIGADQTGPMEQGPADKASRFYRIGAKCNECGACLGVCPTQAIK